MRKTKRGYGDKNIPRQKERERGGWGKKWTVRERERGQKIDKKRERWGYAERVREKESVCVWGRERERERECEP